MLKILWVDPVKVLEYFYELPTFGENQKFHQTNYSQITLMKTEH